MKQYCIYYYDGEIEYVEAYSVRVHHGTAEFDTGHHTTLIRRNVKAVELA